jgi:hypothetical protein
MIVAQIVLNQFFAFARIGQQSLPVHRNQTGPALLKHTGGECRSPDDWGQASVAVPTIGGRGAYRDPAHSCEALGCDVKP